MAGREHWDHRYEITGIDQVSWFEPEPTVSLELFEAAGVSADDAVIDIGGGASRLADRLLDRGFGEVTVLDVSGIALAAARSRLGDDAARVTWIEADIQDWLPGRRWQVWHDRAVFHFLTAPADRERYLTTLRTAIAPGGVVVIGTFAEDGPERCSGLPVARYDGVTLLDTLRTVLPVREVTTCRRVHVTPAGVEQSFTWIATRLVA